MVTTTRFRGHTNSDVVEYTREKIRVRKVPVTTKVFQLDGGMVSSHKGFAFNTFLLLYYSLILGLSSSLVSIVSSFALIINEFSDPIVGAISDDY